MDFGYILEQEIMKVANRMSYVGDGEGGIKVMSMFWAEVNV